jgi:hypothetical protein
LRELATGAKIGNTAMTTAGHNFSAARELSARIPFFPKQTAARKNFPSVGLDVAWEEWQVAVDARTAIASPRLVET